MSREQELRKLTLRWNDAWNSHKGTELAKLFADDGTFFEPDMTTGPVPGKKGIAQSAENLWDAWPKAKFEAVNMVINDPWVALEWRSTATHRSGVEYTLQGVDVLRWKGDLLVEVRTYYDEHGRRKAIGK